MGKYKITLYVETDTPTEATDLAQEVLIHAQEAHIVVGGIKVKPVVEPLLSERLTRV